MFLDLFLFLVVDDFKHGVANPIIENDFSYMARRGTFLKTH